MGKTRYAMGFLLYHSSDGPEVFLIEKKRPDWQAGRLNGVGGHVEEGEEPIAAMRREFKEEAGLDFDRWSPLLVLENDERELHVFYGHATAAEMVEVRSVTDEQVSAVRVTDLLRAGSWSWKAALRNVPWMVSMAQSFGAAGEEAPGEPYLIRDERKRT